LSSRGRVDATAASAVAGIEGQASAAKATIQASFGAEIAALDSAAVKAEQANAKALSTAQKAVNERVDQTKKDIEKKFSDALKRIGARIDRGKTEDTAAMVKTLKDEAHTGIEGQVKRVDQDARTEMGRYSQGTERGRAQRSAVDRVRQKLVTDIRAQEPEIGKSIDDEFSKVPDKIEEKREEIRRELDKPRSEIVGAIEGAAPADTGRLAQACERGK